MALLDQIIAAACAGIAAGHSHPRPTLKLIAAGLVCGLLGAGLLLVGLTAALAERWGFPVAALLMAALLLGVALLLALLALRSRTAPPRPPPPRPPSPLLDMLLDVASLASRGGRTSPMMMAVALLGGVAVSLSPPLRRSLAKILQQDFTAKK